MDDNQRRRLIPQETKLRADLKMSIEDISPETVINDALQTMAIEVTRYRSKVARGIPLEVNEARVLQGYIKAMCELQKERRELARADQLHKLSDEELMVLAKKVLSEGSTVIVQSEPHEEENSKENE